MGFYLRKSFRLGPIRFNLSKSGVGLSAGVKGARIGLNAKGKKYVHFGRGGIYYRKTLPEGNPKQESESAASEIAVSWGVLLIILIGALLFFAIVLS